MSESTPRASASFSRVMSMGSLSRFTSNVAPPQLEELKLSHILNGETCPPISFADFAAFVAHQEYTTENLLFVVWYRNYRARFEALDNKTKAAVPIPSTRLGDRYTPFAYLDKALAERRAAGLDREQPDGGISFEQLVRVESTLPRQKKGGKKQQSGSDGFKPCAWAVDGTCGDGSCGVHKRKPSLLSRLTSRTPSVKEVNLCASRSILHATLHPLLPPPGTVFTPPESQPMRAEAQRAFATFLRKGGSRELGISDELREFAKECLGRSTAPEAFLPIYEEIYHAVETQSLPRFLTSAKRNINRPKELFWYAVGLADLCIGVVIFLILTLLLPSHPFGWRALRLISTVFVSFGIMQAYSAYRGFCSQVWGRSNRQVRPWEMDELDDEEIRLESMPPYERESNESEAKQVDSADEGSVGEVKLGPELSDEACLPKVPKEGRFGDGDGQLPAGVHALADLGGCAKASDETIEYAYSPGSPDSPKTGTLSVALPSLGNVELSPTKRRQLEIREATVKAPPAHEAFPFVNGAALLPASSTTDSRHLRTISPFDMNYQPTTAGDGRSERRVSMNGGEASDGDEGLREFARRTSRDLSTLLVSLRRASAQPTMVARERSRSRTTEDDMFTLNLDLDTDKKPKVFGPERLIEDPRVRKLMSSIVRDILVMGMIVGAIWVVLCFAVPCRGLAS